LLKERNGEIKRLNNELDLSRVSNEKLNSEKANLIGQIERYKTHIMILTEQNQKLSEELDAITERDERIRQQLNRKEKLGNLVSKNRSYLESSLSNLDEFLNKANTNRTMSPSYNNRQQK